MNQNTKRFVLLNLPYVLMGLYATNLGLAWRLAVGTDFSEKMMSLMSVLPDALGRIVPSFHQRDLAVGLCCGVGLRRAVCRKSKNARKYRHGSEYGSARWGNAKDIEPYVALKFEDNIIPTQTERLTMSSRPKDPKTARNKNVLIVGGSRSGQTPFWIQPNLQQNHTSYVLTDPKGYTWLG